MLPVSAAAIAASGREYVGRASVRRLIDDGIRERADAADLDLDDVSGLHPERRVAGGADAARRTGRDHVARLEPRERRAVLGPRAPLGAESPHAFVLSDP